MNTDLNTPATPSADEEIERIIDSYYPSTERTREKDAMRSALIEQRALLSASHANESLRSQLTEAQRELSRSREEIAEISARLFDSGTQLTEAQKLISDNHLVIEGLGDDLKEANAKLAEAAKLIGDAISYAEMPFEAKDCMRRFLTRLSP